MKQMKSQNKLVNSFLIGLLVLVSGFAIYYAIEENGRSSVVVETFDGCVEEGGTIKDTDPRTCKYEDRKYTEIKKTQTAETSQPDDSEQKSSSEDNNTNDEKETDTPEVTTGIYADYDPNYLERAKDGNVLLFFKADWCSSCNAMDKNIQENADDIPSNVTILKVDYSDRKDLVKKYSINRQHSFIEVDENGDPVKNLPAFVSLDHLIANY